MSHQISIQAHKLWQLLSAPTTAVIYKQAVSVTWTILQETGKLIWLVFCLGLVAIDWFWNRSIGLGRETRAWLNRFDRPNDIATEELWQEITSSMQSSFSTLVTKARRQLGLSGQPDAVTKGATGGAIVPKAEIAPISTVSPMKQYEAAGEDEPVIIKGNFMADTQSSMSENSSVDSNENNSNETIQTNAEPETVSVKSVSPQEKERPGEDEEVEHSPLKDTVPPTNRETKR